MDSIFSIDMTWERMWIHMPDSQGASKSEPIVLFLTFFVCCVCFVSKTILQSGEAMNLVSKSIRVNPALWNHVRGIALQRGLTMQTLMDRLLVTYSVRADWQDSVDRPVTTSHKKQKSK